MANISTNKGLDFSTDKPEKLFQDLWRISEDYRTPFEKDWEVAYKLYYNYIDMDSRMPFRANPFVPKIFSMIETFTPRDVKTLFGQRPYFPFEPGIEPFRGNTEAWEDLVDYFADESDFFMTGTKTLKMVRLIGTAVMEPFWDITPCVRHVSKLQMAKGIEIGEKKEREEYYKEMLNWRSWAPWMVGIDPSEEAIKRMRWFYIKQPISKQAMKEHMRWAKYKKKWEELTPDEEYKADSVGKEIKEALGYGFGSDMMDMGMLCRVWFPQEHRYLEFWNGEDCIRDSKDDFEFVPAVRFINTDDPHPGTFFGIGEVKPVEIIQQMLNDSLGQIMDAQQQTVEGVVMYREGAIDPESLVMTGGNRIPVKDDQRPFDDLLQEFKLSPLSKDAYEMFEALKQIFDETVGQSAYARGEMPERKETAYAVRKISEGGDEREEVKIRLAELGALKKLALMNLLVIDENMTERRAKEILGDKARFLIFTNPDDLPGGYAINFLGSDLLADKEGKFNAALNLFNVVGPLINQQEYARILIEKSDIFQQEEVKRITTMPQAQPGEQPGAPGGQPGQPQGPIALPEGVRLSQPEVAGQPAGRSAVTQGET